MGLILGYPDFTQATPLYTPVVSGGSWLSTLPAANVVDRRLSRVARSTDATNASTVMRFDLGVARNVGLLAALIANPTRDSVANVQWRAFSDAGFSSVTYDSGDVQAWPTGVTAEDVLQPDGSFMNVWQGHIPTAVQNYRYWEMAIHNDNNADGYIDVARVIIAGAYRPSVHMSTGASSGLNDDTVVTTTDGGAKLFQAKRQARTDAFSLANVPSSESIGTIRRMQHRLGLSGQFFFVWDESDTYQYERSYLATLEELGPLDYGFSSDYNTASFKAVEVL